MHELITTTVIPRRFPVHLLPCGPRGALPAPRRQCPVSLLACLVPPCTGTHLSPCWYKVGGPSLWLGLLLHPLLGMPSTAGAALLACWAWEGGSCACTGMQECVSHQSPISLSPSGLMCLLFWSIPLRVCCSCCGTAPSAPAPVWVLTPCVTLREVTSVRLSLQMSLAWYVSLSKVRSCTEQFSSEKQRSRSPVRALQEVQQPPHSHTHPPSLGERCHLSLLLA